MQIFFLIIENIQDFYGNLVFKIDIFVLMFCYLVLYLCYIFLLNLYDFQLRNGVEKVKLYLCIQMMGLVVIVSMMKYVKYLKRYSMIQFVQVLCLKWKSLCGFFVKLLSILVLFWIVIWGKFIFLKSVYLRFKK